jgi:drug/metabolite transporter (DMT)-like permease
MSSAGGLAVPALAALAAAGAFGVAAALQHRQAGLAPQRRGLSLRLLADVARRPLWLAGLALAAAAYGLQALALAFGPLTLVAPIVAADLLFALPLTARWSRRPLRARDWAGCLLVAAGVAGFLAVAPPSQGRADGPAAGWLLAFAIVAVITALAAALGRLAGPAVRAGLLAAATGVVFGLTAAVTASFARLLRHEGAAAVLVHWQPWALVTLGITGIALSTGAFQAGSLAASLPIIDTVEPMAGVVIGALLFDERLAASPTALVAQLIAAAVAAAGIVVLGPSLAAGSAGPAREPAQGGAARGSRAVPGGPGIRPGQDQTWRAPARTSQDHGQNPQAMTKLGRPARPRLTAARPHRVQVTGGGRGLLEAGRQATTPEARPDPDRDQQLRATP